MKGMWFSKERSIGILKEAECETSTIGAVFGKHGKSEEYQLVYALLSRQGILGHEKISSSLTVTGTSQRRDPFLLIFDFKTYNRHSLMTFRNPVLNERFQGIERSKKKHCMVRKLVRRETGMKR